MSKIEQAAAITFQNWAAPYADLLGKMGLSASEPTLRAAALLSIAEASKPVTYEEIRARIESSRAVPGKNTVDGIRVALSDLRELARKSGACEIETTPDGRTKRFSLRSTPPTFDAHGIAYDLNSGEDTIEEMARSLVTARALPPRFVFCLPQAAHTWAVANRSKTDYASKHIERNALTRMLGSDQPAFQAFSKSLSTRKKVDVIGLGVGTGLGEILLLEDVLKNQDQSVQVDYAAFDRSPVLLCSHLEEINARLDRHLRSGRLRCVGICGNFLKLDDVLQRARDTAEREKMADFMQDPEAPAIATLFGNCLLNEPSQEAAILNSLSTNIPQRPLVLALGVSEKRKKVPYPKSLAQFLATAPMELLRYGEHVSSTGELWKIESVEDAEDKDKGAEFDLQLKDEDFGQPIPEDKNARFYIEYTDSYRSFDASGASLKGDLYVFWYKLKKDLKITCGDWTDVLPKGELILLYSIAKIEIVSLATMLRRLRFDVETGEIEAIPDAGGAEHHGVLVLAAKSR